MSASANKDLPPRNPPGAIRHAALAVRRNVGGAVSDPGLRLRQLRAGRGALQGRRSRLSVFALRQSDRRHVRAAHGGVRGRGSRARDRDRHGRGHDLAGRPAQGRRSRRRLEGDVRLLPLRGRGLPAALRRRLDAWSTAAISTPGATRCGRTPRRSFSKARPIRRSKSSTSPRWPRSRTRPAPRSWSTTCSRRRCCRARSRSAPTASSIRRPSTSTARAAASAASSSARRNSSRTTSTCCIRQTGPSMSPFNAWVLLKGLETLAVRVRRQTDTAATVAVALAEHPKISRLIYPGRPDHPQAAIVQKQMRGGSTLVAFEVKGGKKAAFRFQDALKLVRISNNLGDAKSLITHPATTTHQRLTPRAARRARHHRRAGAAVVSGSNIPTISSRTCSRRSRRCKGCHHPRKRVIQYARGLAGAACREARVQ